MDTDEDIVNLLDVLLNILNESNTGLSSQYTVIQRLRIHLEKHLVEEFRILERKERGK